MIAMGIDSPPFHFMTLPLFLLEFGTVEEPKPEHFWACLTIMSNYKKNLCAGLSS